MNNSLLLKNLGYFSIVTALLLLIGSIFIYSSSSIYALETFHSSHYYVKQHLIGLMAGFFAAFLTQLIPVSFIKKTSFIALLTATALTGLTLIGSLSSRIHGSSRWLNIAGFKFQPSELLKIGLIVCVAAYISNKNLATIRLKEYIPLLIIIAVPSLILLKQPDFGLTVTLFLTILGMLFIARLNLMHLALVIGSFLPLALWLALSKAYRLKRILTFLNPWSDPEGAGFQIIQSLIAIGTGGFWGKGISQSHQKFFYLPMQHTDFIFAIIAEETGFFGASLVVILFALFLYFGLRIALALEDPFCQLVASGFILNISLQAVVNMCVASGIAPTKGIGLPFISYGNTALITNILMIGIIIRLVRHTLRLRFGKNYGKNKGHRNSARISI